jgi:hypothetical protein
MTLTDQQVIDIVHEMLDRANIRPEDRVRHLRERGTTLPTIKPLIDRYLVIKDPPPTCQVEHDHWEGPMICGNTLPCRTHGGR